MDKEKIKTIALIILIVLLLIGILILVVGCNSTNYMDGWNDRIKTEFRHPEDCKIKYDVVINCPDLSIQVIHRSGLVQSKSYISEMIRCTELYTGICGSSAIDIIYTKRN